MVDVNDGFWYVRMISDDHYVISTETCNQLLVAMQNKAPYVKFQDAFGHTFIANPAFVSNIDWSTPDIRDATFIWNRQVEAEAKDREQRLGKPEWES